jgi:hypothetical protein
LFPPDDERLSLETRRGREINTLKKAKKVSQVGYNIQKCLRMHGQQNIKFCIFHNCCAGVLVSVTQTG